MQRIDAAIKWDNGKAYFFGGDEYVRYDIAADRADPGYPKKITDVQNWPDLSHLGGKLHAAVNWMNGKAYFFRGGRYIRWDLGTDRADPGYPKDIEPNWPGLHAGLLNPWSQIRGIVNWENGKVYFFMASNVVGLSSPDTMYYRYDVAADKVDPGYPKKIPGNWPGLWHNKLDAAVNWGNGKAYFFSGDDYIRYDIASDKPDSGYPQKIRAHWPGLLKP